MKRVMLVFGTRPEAIKMCPLVNELKKREKLQTIVCVTGQHRQMLDQVLEAFHVVPDYDLSIMKDKQTLFDVTVNILERIKAVLETEKPDVVLVHGDTSTTFVTALACFYMQIPVGHVEAGLRTYDIYSPYPEEFNRQAVSIIAKYNFARFTKQTMADALHHIQTAEIDSVRFPMLSGAYQIIALLAHMEQHLATSGIGLRQVCDWAVTAHALRNCFDGETLALLERCGLLRFARIMTRLCERYLGLPPCPWTADASDALVDAMLSDVLEGGNFQAQYAKRPLADVLTDAYDVSGKGRNSLFRNYIRYLKKYLRQYEPWAKSRLWLPVFGVFLPARWGVRVLLGKRKQINLVHAVGMARERDKLLRELELYR